MRKGQRGNKAGSKERSRESVTQKLVLYAKDIIETDFISLPPTENVFNASKLMSERRHGFVIVVSEDKRPAGIVTEWDVLEKIVATNRDPKRTTLSDIMSVSLVTVSPDTGIAQIATIMSERGIRRILVVQDQKMIGVITSRAILKSLKQYVDRISSEIARFQAPYF
jgi:CBS domain-containing protein